MVFQLFSSLIAFISRFELDSGHIFFAVVGIIFTLMSYGGHRELVNKKKSAAKATEN